MTSTTHGDDCALPALYWLPRRRRPVPPPHVASRPGACLCFRDALQPDACRPDSSATTARSLTSPPRFQDEEERGPGGKTRRAGPRRWASVVGRAYIRIPLRRVDSPQERHPSFSFCLPFAEPVVLEHSSCANDFYSGMDTNLRPAPAENAWKDFSHKLRATLRMGRVSRARRRPSLGNSSDRKGFSCGAETRRKDFSCEAETPRRDFSEEMLGGSSRARRRVLVRGGRKS
jgi:hypothetical protein